MGEEFQAGVCGGSWWNLSRSGFGLSPCSSVMHDHMGSLGWPAGQDLVDLKPIRSSDNDSSSPSDNSVVYQDIQKSHHQGGRDDLSMDSTLQMMGIGLSSSTTSDWNQDLISGSGRAESNYHHNHSMLLENLNSSFNFSNGAQDSSISTFKPADQDFSLNSITTTAEGTATCQGLSTSFPMSSASYGFPSTLLQNLFEADSQPQQSLYDDNRSSMNFYATTKPNEFLPSSPKFSSFLRPSLPKSRTPFWNDIRGSINFPSTESQSSSSNLIAKANNREIRDSASAMKKSTSEPAFKRPRIETPSPLPTFKVRKEKLGDRITALQQLVSPFGKTDTASVLHEAIEYIRLLHDQVSVLSTPYMKNGNSTQRQQIPDKLKDAEGPKQDLRSRGLCLVPISSTFPVAAETTADFWASPFGGAFR
ncbi:hypothetical protein RJ640_017534 [Escallonia rubra]|uniref:BHLH domain-containing protein n=1 Tax=Escallonia rubra TaxID=112253 RepID=A0AA88RRU5_9ASTE|nr:hypothetical protein RJ640_017534 [Escallonia rubra]